MVLSSGRMENQAKVIIPVGVIIYVSGRLFKELSSKIELDKDIFLRVKLQGLYDGS